MSQPLIPLPLLDMEFPIPPRDAAYVVLSIYPTTRFQIDCVMRQEEGKRWILAFSNDELGHIGSMTIEGIKGEANQTKVVSRISEKVTFDEVKSSLTTYPPEATIISELESDEHALAERLAWIEKKRPEMWNMFWISLWEQIKTTYPQLNDVSIHRHRKNRQAGHKKKKQLSTDVKIDKLRKYRRDRIKANSPVYKTVACTIGDFKVDPDTVRKHAPELWKNWDDLTYDID